MSVSDELLFLLIAVLSVLMQTVSLLVWVWFWDFFNPLQLYFVLLDGWQYTHRTVMFCDG